MSDKMDAQLFSQLKCDFLSSDENQIDYRTFLSSVYEFSLLTSQIKQDTIGQINTDLSRRDDRLRGLALLSHVLEQCSEEIFSKSYNVWGLTLTNIVSDSSEENSVVINQACFVLAQYIQLLSSFSESKRSFGQDVLPGFLTTLLDNKTKKQPHNEAIFGILSRCIQAFPGPCKIFKQRIEKNAVSAFDSRSKTLRAAAGSCWADTARCTKPGVTGTQAWSDEADRLLAYLHTVQNQLYGDIESGFKSSTHLVAAEPLLLSEIPSTEPSRTMNLCRWYDGAATALCCLLSREFPAVVRLPLDDVLKLVLSAFVVLPRDLSIRPSEAKLRLLSVLPFVHMSTLNMLEALIRVRRLDLIRHADAINDQLLEMLRATSSSEAAKSGRRQFRHLRCATYKVFLTWLQELGDASGLNSLRVCTELVQEILKDSKAQEQDVVKLDLKERKVDFKSSVSGGASKKRKRNTAFGGGGSQTTSHESANVFKNSDICLAALQVLRQLITGCCATLPASQMRVILDFCLPLVYSIQRHVWDNNTRRIPSPYGDASCRLAFYQVLGASCFSSVLQPPSDIIRIFSCAQHDSDLSISTFCCAALSACMNMRQVKRGKRAQEVGTHASMNSAVLHSTGDRKEEWASIRATVGASQPIMNFSRAADECNTFEPSVDDDVEMLAGESVEIASANNEIDEKVTLDGDVEEDDDEDNDEDDDVDDDDKVEDAIEAKKDNTEKSVEVDTRNEVANNERNGLAINGSASLQQDSERVGDEPTVEEMLKSFYDNN